MLITKIAANVHSTLPLAIQSEYVQDPGNPGTYYLQTDEINELRNAKQRETTARVEADGKVANLTTELATLRTELVQIKKDSPDAAAREKEINQRIAAALIEEKKLTKAESDKAASYEKTIVDIVRQQTIKNAVNGLTDASDEDLLTVAVKDRISVTLVDGKPKVLFLDKDGKETVDTLDTFRTGVANDTRYAKLITATKASGTGSAGSKSGQSPSGATGTKKFAEMTESERTSLFRSNPGEFQRLAGIQKQLDAEKVQSSQQVLIR